MLPDFVMLPNASYVNVCDHAGEELQLVPEVRARPSYVYVHVWLSDVLGIVSLTVNWFRVPLVYQSRVPVSDLPFTVNT